MYIRNGFKNLRIIDLKFNKIAALISKENYFTTPTEVRQRKK